MTLKTWLTLALAMLLAHLGPAQSLPLSPRMTHDDATTNLGSRAHVLPGAAPTAAVSIPDAEAGSDTEAKPLKVPAKASNASSPLRASAFGAQALPASVKLVYRVDSNKFPYRLQTELLWQQHDQTYRARMSFGAFGLSRVQTSRGRIDEHGLAPARFSDKFRSEVAANFDRERGVVTFSANTPELPLQPGAQDRLSVTIQLAALVADAPQRFTPGTTLSIQTIGPRGGEVWLFTFGAMEALDLPGGVLQGLKLWRQPRKPDDQKLEIWLAPELAYMPARIRITETNGEFVDQKWQASEAADGP